MIQQPFSQTHQWLSLWSGTLGGSNPIRLTVKPNRKAKLELFALERYLDTLVATISNLQKMETRKNTRANHFHFHGYNFY